MCSLKRAEVTSDFCLLRAQVLLNFLLAIIVDAFSVVKDNTSESTGLHEELAQMAREKWRAVLGRMLNVHYIPSSRLSTLLKHWAGSDLDELKTRKAAGDEAQKRIKVPTYSPNSAALISRRTLATLDAHARAPRGVQQRSQGWNAREWCVCTCR